MENHRAIIDAIETALLRNATNARVRYLKSFSGMVFLRQIEFMSQVDILVGPHGAEMTSIAYLPDCGGVLELFPRGFYFPDFFGSLAVASGHSHLSLYTGSQQHRTQELEYYMQKGRRYMARRFQVTANPELVVEAVEELIRKRESCCRDKESPITL